VNVDMKVDKMFIVNVQYMKRFYLFIYCYPDPKIWDIYNLNNICVIFLSLKIQFGIF